MEKFGTILPVGTSGFSDLVKEFLEKYEPPELDEIPYTAFIRADTPVGPHEKPRDDDIFNLLMWGKEHPNFVWQSIQDDSFPPYYVQRIELRKILDSIDEGNMNILLHSDLGNGKTLMLEGLKYIATNNDIEVFSLRERTDTIYDEIDHILKLNRPVIIIIENYHNELDLIELINLKRPNNIVMVFTSRSTVNDIFFDRLDDALNHQDIAEFDLNCLSDDDVDKLLNLLESYGLWGSRAGLSPKRKKDYISYDCKCEFQNVLVDLIKSPDIHNRFQKIITALNEKKDYYKVIILSFVLELLGVSPRVDMIMELLNTNVINSTRFRKNELVRQFINFNTDQIIVKSSVLARYMLNSLSDSSLIVDTLIETAINSEALKRNRNIYNHIFRNLMLYSTVQSMLPEKNKRPSIIRYYESLKNLYHTNRNPFFWLQYAIARLFFREYDKASIYFDNAYSYAKLKRGFNTYQIDNHYARYLLENAVAENNEHKCMTAFRAAHLIISRQIKHERLHYPYKVASNYYDFYYQFYDRVRDLDREYIVICCKYVLGQIEKLPPKRRSNKYVIGCEARLNEVLTDCQQRS